MVVPPFHPKCWSFLVGKTPWVCWVPPTILGNPDMARESHHPTLSTSCQRQGRALQEQTAMDWHLRSGQVPRGAVSEHDSLSGLGWLEDSSSGFFASENSCPSQKQHETKKTTRKNNKMKPLLGGDGFDWQLCQRTCMLRPWSSYEHLCTVSSIYHLFTYLPWFNIIYQSFSWLLCYMYIGKIFHFHEWYGIIIFKWHPVWILTKVFHREGQRWRLKSYR